MKRYTFMIIPHKSGKRPIEFNIGKMMVSAMGLFVVALIIIFGSTIYLSSKIANITVKYYKLENRNKEVLTRLDDFSSKTDDLKKVILNLKEQDQEIRRLLGLKPNNNYFSASLKKK